MNIGLNMCLDRLEEAGFKGWFPILLDTVLQQFQLEVQHRRRFSCHYSVQSFVDNGNNGTK